MTGSDPTQTLPESTPLLGLQPLTRSLTPTAYSYTPLPSSPDYIRLVDLLPGRRNSPITFRLRAVPLAAAGTYTALSYCWGDPSICKPIFSDDHDDGGGGGMLRITTNLHALLLAFRGTPESSQTHTLWIDAICIDQSNIPERNSQVRLMRHIYLSATEVCVWLG
jgi:hypothetical protein